MANTPGTNKVRARLKNIPFLIRTVQGRTGQAIVTPQAFEELRMAVLELVYEVEAIGEQPPEPEDQQ